jgi:hypothetical protein
MRAFSLAWALGASCLIVFAGQARALPKPRGSEPQRLADAAEKRETVVEVSVLHGTHERRDNDPRIGPMPELREGPFANYSSYALLSRVALPLPRGGKRQLTLPNGRLFEARLEEILPDGSSRLVASINRPGGKDFLPLLEVKARPGQSFIVAGQSYKRGILVLVIKVLR